MGILYLVLTTAKPSLDKPRLMVVEIQHLPDIEKTDSEEEISRQK